MAMSSGKSSSVAAVLLLVAVLAGTCASVADVQFTFTSGCNKTVVITTATSNVTLAPNATVPSLERPSEFFVGTVTFKTTDGVPPVTTTTCILPPEIRDLLRCFGGLITNIKVTCSRNCIALTLTYELPLPPFITYTVEMGPYCLCV